MRISMIATASLRLIVADQRPLAASRCLADLQMWVNGRFRLKAACNDCPLSESLVTDELGVSGAVARTVGSSNNDEVSMPPTIGAAVRCITSDASFVTERNGQQTVHDDGINDARVLAGADVRIACARKPMSRYPMRR